MKNSRIFIIILAAFLCTVVNASAGEEIEPQGFLAIAKVTGACGIMNEMISFQEKTKMTAGDDFVVRFWQAESARQGKTVQQMIESCNKAISAYDNLWKLMEQQKQ